MIYSPFVLFKRFGYALAGAIMILVMIRAILPIALKRYVNQQLNRIPDYSGSVGDIDLHLFRGAYTVNDLELNKTSGTVPVPLIHAPIVDLSVEWSALFKGEFVGEISLERPKLNFVNGRTKTDSQLRVDSEWLAAVKDLFPLRIDRFEVQDGEVYYRDFHSTPKINVKLHHVDAVGTNFSNTRTPKKGRVAQVHLSAMAEKDGRLTVKTNVEPGARQPTFDLELSLVALSVSELNDILASYAGVDAEAGTIDIYSNILAADGEIRGTVKPLVKNISIANSSDSSLAEAVWENIVGLAAEIFENQRKDQIGTVVKFYGRIDDPKAQVWSTIVELIRNAFVKGLGPGAERIYQAHQRSSP